MIALDTNVLVRYLVEDDAEQAARAAEVIEGASDRGDKLFVSHIVLCELVWVLAGAYGRGRPEIVRVLRAILKTAQFAVEDVDLAHRALLRFQDDRADFAGFLLLERARAAGCDHLVSFDERLLTPDGFCVQPGGPG